MYFSMIFESIISLRIPNWILFINTFIDKLIKWRENKKIREAGCCHTFKILNDHAFLNINVQI